MQPGTYTWEHNARDCVRVRLLLEPLRKLDVAVWWNSRLAQSSLLLWVPLHSESVEFGDLTGNQYGTPLHRIGLGTFAVNVAIQVLRATYDPSTRVRGILSNPNDDSLTTELRARLAESRRAFWSRFGLSISPGHYEKLVGTVGALNPVTSGFVAGQFPRYLSLSEFKYERRL